MNITMAVTRRLSENQLQKVQKFFLVWIKREQSILREKLAHKRQFDILLRGTRGPAAGSSEATGGARWAKSKTFHTEERDEEHDEGVHFTRDGSQTSTICVIHEIISQAH